MIIEKNDICLVYQKDAYIYRVSAEEIAKILKKEVSKYIENINVLVNTPFKNLTDDEFFDIISSAYDISLEEKDYLKIISKINNKKYNEFTEIGTFMTFTDVVTEGKGRNFGWERQLYQVRYVVAVCKDCDIPYGSAFSKLEISKMLENKSIVIVKEKSKALTYKPDFKEESVEVFPIKSLELSNLEPENLKIFVSILRRKFTKKKVLNDMKVYIEQLQEEIDEILLNYPNDYDHIQIAEIAAKWFDTSKEKQIYESLLERLS